MMMSEHLAMFKNRVLSCARPVIFANEDLGFPSINGSGFLLTLFGDVFFVTTQHALAGYDLNTHFPSVRYNFESNQVIQQKKRLRFHPIDSGDSDHADIVIYQMDQAQLDWTKLHAAPPFEIGPSNVLLAYRPDLKLHYGGFPSDARNLDYDRQIYGLELTLGALSYQCATNCLHIHQGIATVADDHPSFDGLSGAPLFHINGLGGGGISAQFAGMLIRASRDSKIMRFIGGGFVAQYLLNFYADGLSEQQAHQRFADLFAMHYPEWQR